MHGYTVRFDGASDEPGPNYTAMRGRFVILKGDRELTTLAPERRAYVQPQQTTTVPALMTTPLGDLYAVIGDPQAAGANPNPGFKMSIFPRIASATIGSSSGGNRGTRRSERSIM